MTEIINKFYDINGEEIIRHERQHGCILVLKRQVKITNRHFLKIYTCLQHDVEVCKCGIPFGRHVEYTEVQKLKKENETKNKNLSVQRG